MRARIVVAVVAWLLGAATATCGSLLAVSLLGDGFGVNGAFSQQLTVAAVNRALAGTRPERSPSPARYPGTLSPARTSHRHGADAAPAPSPAPTASVSASDAPTVLTSPAGTVTATCGPAGVYLLSWSPAQGYGVDHVARGPAAAASVVFDAGPRAATMRIVCSGGTPVADTSWGSDGDGSGSPDE